MGQEKRPSSKRRLEIQLGKLETLENPQLGLEQYPISPEVASELLYMAGFEHSDLEGSIVDLGTGTGRLAIGAALMGAREVLGLDIDKRSIRLAIRNGRRARVKADWVIGNLDSVRGNFSTIIMNPPYGTRSPHQDTQFLSHAFDLAPISYSIHKTSTQRYLVQFVNKKGRRVDQVRRMTMQIPHLFGFHRKKWEAIHVDLYRIIA